MPPRPFTQRLTYVVCRRSFGAPAENGQMRNNWVFFVCEHATRFSGQRETFQAFTLIHVDRFFITILVAADIGFRWVQCDHTFIREVVDIGSAIAARTSGNE